MKCDILVVGAGPAGASAARAAAREGARVLMVERKRRVGVPVRCAEYIPAPLVGEVGLGTGYLVQRLSGMRTYVGGQLASEMTAPGFIIRRDEFDAMLAEEAVASGARLLLGARAVGLEGREIWVRWAPEGKTLSIRAEIVLGADGPLSRVGRWVGSVNPHLLPAIQVRARLREPMEHTEIYLEPEFRAGYGWLFPKKGWANLGVGMQPEGRQGGLASTLKALLGRLVATGKVEPPPVGRSGGWIPVGPPRRAVFDRILLAGDAAGHVHPITGGGVAMAVSGGALAGTWAARAVGSGSMALLERYEEAWRDLWGETLATAYEKRTLMERNWSQFPRFVPSCWVGFRDYHARRSATS